MIFVNLTNRALWFLYTEQTGEFTIFVNWTNRALRFLYTEQTGEFTNFVRWTIRVIPVFCTLNKPGFTIFVHWTNHAPSLVFFYTTMRQTNSSSYILRIITILFLSMKIDIFKTIKDFNITFNITYVWRGVFLKNLVRKHVYQIMENNRDCE